MSNLSFFVLCFFVGALILGVNMRFRGETKILEKLSDAVIIVGECFGIGFVVLTGLGLAYGVVRLLAGKLF